ncbi:hypothetical protein CfE428DRAFT_5166 [Chthoniobacter flavus Ellin428]|uniref:Uncharacterized protein n=1 Tax=Chthoniobacter flavus Ellin428 TaxID=497964 RepID=B4D8C6_9BACT|nr:hypothetical protein [Chthoniobacter flavus]EDY17319.1 hypothetical protein CfE428DRAFT_5166 [Chthoniobacter flavus Ellin428]
MAVEPVHGQPLQAIQQWRRAEDQADDDNAKGRGLGGTAPQHRAEQGQIAEQENECAYRAVGRHDLPQRNPTQRHRDDGEGKLRREHEERATEPAGGFSQEDGQRTKPRHAQQAERLLLLLLGNS